MLGRLGGSSNTNQIQQPEPHSRMDSFMFGNRPAPPMQRNSLPTRLQQLNPSNLLNSPQVNKGLSGFSGILNNVQQILQLVETTTPIIKEYGPMVKNLPAMYRMVKAFNELEGDEESEQEGKKLQSKPESVEEEDATPGKEKTVKNTKEERNKNNKSTESGLSTPKLYL